MSMPQSRSTFLGWLALVPAAEATATNGSPATFPEPSAVGPREVVLKAVINGAALVPDGCSWQD